MDQQAEARGHVQEDWEALFEEAIKLPGISTLLQIYDDAESAYSAAYAQQPQPSEYISSSANTPLTRQE